MRKSEVSDLTSLNSDYQKAFAIPNKRQAKIRVAELDRLIQIQSIVVETQKNLPVQSEQKQQNKQMLEDFIAERCAINNTDYDC